jgi:diguanylate cyclase (GGDEF)-like protein
MLQDDLTDQSTRRWRLATVTRTFAFGLLAVIALGGWAVIHDALHIDSLAEESRQRILPMIFEREWAVLNLERLKQYGTIIETAGEQQLRADTRAMAAFLASHPSFQFEPSLVEAVERSDRAIGALATAKDEADLLRRQGQSAAADQLERREAANWHGVKASLDTLSDYLSVSATKLADERAAATEKAAHQVVILVIAFFGLDAILLAVAALFVHRLLLKPILAITHALDIDRVREARPLPTSSIAEIDTLYRSTERMAYAMTEIEEANRQARALQAELRRLASTDELTGLANRRWFLEMATRELERCRRFRQAFSVLMVDVDHFKLINDTHGHAVGDAVLVAVARALESSLRSVDLLGRVGGEEFAAGLPQTLGDDALATAERLRANVEAISITLESGATLRLTTSVGVTVVQAGDATLDVLMARADEALYTAKRAGRNRVVVL